jgi:WhiB family redox-sensing transcriptional regulator
MSTPNLRGIVASPEWMGEALCRQSDPELFYPDTGHNSRDARAVCVRCPVKAECLAYAIEHHERYGVWGGLSERQRRHLRETGGRSVNRTRTDAREQPWWQRGPDEREGVVRELAATLTDAQIGVRLGCHRKTVLAIRTANGIPPARPRCGGTARAGVA